MISWHGSPAWSGRFPDASSRRPASSKASCSRCAGVRSSGPSASSGRFADSGVRMVSQIARHDGVRCPSSRPVESGLRIRLSRRWDCCRRCSSGHGPSGSRWARIRRPSNRTVRGSLVRACSSSVASTRPACSARSGSGMASTTSATSAACSHPISPAANASAVAGNSGSNGSPVNPRRAPNPLHRQVPLTRLRPGTPQLRLDQLGQAAES